MFNVRVIHNPADYHYSSPFTAGPVPTYENAKSVVTGKLTLINLYAFNSSAATVYLALVDTPNATLASATRVVVYPVPATSYVSIATPGGDRFEGGLYLKAFTDTALGTPAGSVMSYQVDYDAYVGFVS